MSRARDIIKTLAPAKCKKCGSPLVDGLCTDETCPYSDHDQAIVLKDWYEPRTESRAKVFMTQVAAHDKKLQQQRFEVNGDWQGWVADGLGNVLYSLEAQHPPRVRMLSIARFNVHEYEQRTGSAPTGWISLRKIGYWNHQGRYFPPTRS